MSTSRAFVIEMVVEQKLNYCNKGGQYKDFPLPRGCRVLHEIFVQAVDIDPAGRYG
jgi:hypothetical protein